VKLIGGGSSATVLDSDSAVVFEQGSGGPNGPYNITIEGMTIRGTGGGARYNTEGEPGGIVYRDVIFDTAGIGIDLALKNPDHVTYRIDLARVDFKNPGAAAIRGAVRMATLDVCIMGAWRGGQVPSALIDLRGKGCSVDIRRAWLESELPENCRMLRIEGGGPGYEAKVAMNTNVWFEAKNAGYGQAAYEFLNSFVTAGFINNSSEDYTFDFRDGSRLDAAVIRSHKPLAQAFRCDAQSGVYIAGQKQQTAVIQQEQ
jgi:hypothetical protein